MADPADDETESAACAAAHADAGSLVEQIKHLADDTRTAFEAEIAWQGARAGHAAGQVPGIAAWAGIAVLCAFIALLALAFGAILALSPMIGAVLATLLVTGTLLAAALGAGLAARARLRRLKTAAFPAKPPVQR